MKTTTRSILTLRPLLLVGAALLWLAATPGRAHAQANINFSGGLGTPLTLTLNAPVTYVITTAGSADPGFILQGTGNLGSSTPLTGSLTFTINNGAAQTINNLQSNTTISTTVTPTDTILYNTNTYTFAAGDIVRLLAATTTTTANVTAAPPTATSFQTFIIGTNGTRLDAVNGVPEPGTWTLLGIGGGTLLGLTMRRARRA